MARRSVMLPRARLFEDCSRPAWIVAENPWHKLLEVRALPAGTDLMRTYIVELLRYHDAGWRLNDFSSFGACFYATKEREDKRHVYITTIDPAAPKPKPCNVMDAVWDGGINGISR